MRKIVLLSFVIISMFGCAAAPQAVKPNKPASKITNANYKLFGSDGYGGYEDRRLYELGDNAFAVSFYGNSTTIAFHVADFVLLRSAEVAKENGYEYFYIVESKQYTTEQQISNTKANTNAYTSGRASNYGMADTYISVGGSASGESVTVSGKINYHNIENVIYCFADPPETEKFVYKSSVIIQDISKKYQIKLGREAEILEKERHQQEIEYPKKIKEYCSSILHYDPECVGVKWWE